MIRELLWKETRENRWKYVTLWVVFNLPILCVTTLVALSRQARTPFADLSNQTFMKYLPLTLFASPAVITVFLLATGFLAIATFVPELESRSVFFFFEQPLARWRYAVTKLAAGSAHVAAAVIGTSVLAPMVVYAMMLIGGKVTMGSSGAAFGTVMLAAVRSGVWCALVSIAAFAGCALIASAAPRWWLATGVMFVFILLFASVAAGDNRFFNGDAFFDLDGGPGTQSVSASFGNWNWLTVSGPFPPPVHFGQWHLLPAVTPIVLIAAFGAAVALVFERKELK